MHDICPLPPHWNDVFRRLSDAASDADRRIPPPPRPLILGGWNYSNDVEKRDRWLKTIAWAEQWGFAEIVRSVTPQMMYRVESPTDYPIGPDGGPMYLPWTYGSKPKPANADMVQALDVLCGQWVQIAGQQLASVTHPLRFAGPKCRKLVVYADPAVQPPWGTWTVLSDGPERRAFTQLREAVNAAIQPLMVDHIEFIHDSAEAR